MFYIILHTLHRDCTMINHIAVNVNRKRRSAMRWLHVKQNSEIISELFQSFISHVTTSETEIKVFQPR